MWAVSRYIQLRLQRRLLLLFVPLVVIPLLLVGAFLTVSYLNLFTNILDEEEYSRIQTLLSEAESFTDRAHDDVVFLTKINADILQALEARSSTNFRPQDPIYVEAEQEMLGLVDSQTAYTLLQVIDLQGQEIIRIERPDATKSALIAPTLQLGNRSKAPYVVEAQAVPIDQVYLSPIEMYRGSGLTGTQKPLPVVHYVRRVIDPETNEVKGLAVLTVNVQPMFDVFLSNPNDGVMIFDQEGRLLIDTYQPERAIITSGSRTTSTSVVDILGQDTFVSLQAVSGIVKLDSLTVDGVNRSPFVSRLIPSDVSNPTPWHIIEFRQRDGLNVFGSGPLATIIGTSLVAMVGILIIALLVTTFTARQITKPLELLSQRATALRTGQLSAPLEPMIADRTDEIGMLGRTFETMAHDLSNTMASMESQIEARTSDLNTAADIASAANQVRDVDELISLTVNLIRDRFNFYYVQAYLVDEEQQKAVLREGTGYVGRRLLARQHALSLNERSLVARAIRTGGLEVVQDTTQDPDFRPNEFLLETRAELVVPLKTKSSVVGVLDIQHNVANAFDPESLRLFRTLAEQIAITLENVQLFQSTREVASRLSAVTRNFPNGTVLLFDKSYRYLVVDGSDLAAMSLDKERMEGLTIFEALTPEGVDYAKPVYDRALNGEQITQEFKTKDLIYESTTLPVRDEAGEIIGGMVITQNITGRRLVEEEQRLLLDISTQLAVAQTMQEVVNAITTHAASLDVRGLFLIDARQPHTEADTVQGFWLNPYTTTADSHGYVPAETYLEPLSTPLSLAPRLQPTYVEFLGTHPEIKSWEREQFHALQGESFAYIPLMAQGELTAALVYVWDLPHAFPGTEQRILETIGRQISSVVEAIRATENVRRTSAASERRAALLEIVAQVGRLASTILDIDQMLPAVCDVVKSEFELYHVHIYLLDVGGQRLNLAAGAGEVGQLMRSAKHHIVLTREHSLVARAARDKTPVLSDDVLLDSDFLPNPLLPDTRAELAVPLLIGEQLIGVLDIQAAVPSAFNEDEVQVHTTLAGLIAVSVRNAQLFRDVANIRTAFDQHAIVAITDQRGSIVYANDLFSEISGYSHDELIGQDHRLLNSEYHSKEFIRDLWVTIANGQVWHGEIRNRRKDGSFYWVNTTIVPFLDEEGKPYQYIALRSDITAQKAAEEDIVRHATEMEAVARVSSTIATQFDVPTLLEAVANLTQEAFKRYHAQIYLLSAEGEWLVLAAGSGQIGRQLVASGHRIPLAHAHSLVARAARTQGIVSVPDVRQDVSFLPNVLLPYTRSELVVPILYGNQLFGVLDIQDDRPDAFSEPEAQVKQTLANQLAAALENSRQFNMTRRRLEVTQAFSRLNELIREYQGNREALIEKTLEVALPLLQAENAIFARFSQEDHHWYGVLTIGGGLSTDLIRSMIDPAGFYPHGLQAIETKRPVLIGDIRTYEGITAEYIARFKNLAAMLTIPVLIQGKPEGAIFFTYSQTQTFTQEDLDVARSITAQISLGLERASIEEELRLQSALVQTSRDFIALMSIEGLIIYINPAGLEMIGGTLEDMRGRSVLELLDDAGMAKTAYEGIPFALSENYWEGVSSLRTHTGESIPTQQIVFVTRDVQDQISGLALIATDITARLEAQRDIELRNTAIENSSAIVTIADAQQSGIPLIYVNAAFKSSTQYKAEEAIGRDWLFLQGTDHDQPELKVLYKAMRAGASATVTLRNYRKDGTLFYNELSIAPVHNSEGELTHFVTIGNDVTARIDAAEEQKALLDTSLAITQAQTSQALVEAIGIYHPQGLAPRWIGLMYYYYDDRSTKPTHAEVMVSLSPQEPLMPVGTRFSIDDFSVTNSLFEHPDAPLFIEDVLSDPRADAMTREMAEAQGNLAFLLIPLYTAGRWLGVIMITWDQPVSFDERDRRIYTAIHRQATPTIDAFRATVEAQNARTEAVRRANELESVARVSAATTTILELDELLTTVTYLTREIFSLYHVQVYLLDEEQEVLRLAAGSGEAGQLMREAGHQISIHHPNSLVALTARAQTPIIVNDVTGAPDFLPNPLLPDTRAELAVPMIVGSRLIGILDIQADTVGRFTESDEQIISTLADLVSVAVENALAFERERETILRLKEVDRLKQEFLANMSHELRTPLNTIIGYSEVLKDGVDGELGDEAQEDVEAIYSSGKHLLHLINEILDMAKIEAGQMNLMVKEVDVVSLIQEVVRDQQILVKDKSVEMRALEITPIPLVDGDRVRLKQVFLNLLSNAIKFTEHGSITIRYGLQDPNTIRIDVEDTGPGMEQEHLDIIFERFRQVDGSTTRRAGGTGLGLAITRQLVEMHGGQIFVDSQVNVGSIFSFTLPIKPGTSLVSMQDGEHKSSRVK